VRDNPVSLVDWPRAENTEPEALNEVELVSLLQRITDPWAAALAMFIAYTGLRRAEVARLAVADVDVTNAVLWVRGKARSQSHPLPADAVAAAQLLIARADGSEFLIPGGTDASRRGRVAETFRTWQRELKEPRWHPHTLRHSVATIMLRKGVSPAIVQRFLRHASYAMTQRYVHMVEDDLRGATTKLRLLGGDEKKAEHG
jgi:integrase